jgi:polar amino acid transport system permease protein
MQEWAAYIPLMLQGAWMTLRLTALGCAIALLIAFVVGLARLSRSPVVRAAATLYTEFFRGTSVFVQLFWAYYVLPLFGLTLSPFVAGAAVLGLNGGAYGAETVRGAVQSVDRDQLEACTALNLTRYRALRHVIVPQAFPVMLPVFGNNAIELLKSTAVVSLISLSDLTFQAQVARAQTGSDFMPFLFILVVYFCISSAISFAVRGVERRLTRGLDRLGA